MHNVLFSLLYVGLPPKALSTVRGRLCIAFLIYMEIFINALTANVNIWKSIIWTEYVAFFYFVGWGENESIWYVGH
jgi:hypothetical protein